MCHRSARLRIGIEPVKDQRFDDSLRIPEAAAVFIGLKPQTLSGGAVVATACPFPKSGGRCYIRKLTWITGCTRVRARPRARSDEQVLGIQGATPRQRGYPSPPTLRPGAAPNADPWRKVAPSAPLTRLSYRPFLAGASHLRSSMQGRASEASFRGSGHQNLGGRNLHRDSARYMASGRCDGPTLPGPNTEPAASGRDIDDERINVP